MAVICGTLTAMAAVGGTTYTWTGAGDGTSFSNPLNWSPNGLPNGTTQDIAQWDGATTSNLVISVGAAALPGTGFGGLGISLVLTKNQANSVQLISSVAVSGALGLFNVTNGSPNASLILGDSTANLLTIVTRPAGSVHEFLNNSSAASVLNGSLLWEGGGGNAYAVEFGGTGAWTVNTPLQSDTVGPVGITIDGPGGFTWTKTGNTGTSGIGSVSVNGGRLTLESAGLIPTSTSQPITNNGTLVFDAGSQADTISRDISGSGGLQVNSGTLTLTGANTYTGNTVLNGGELIVASAENPGTSGPLGVGGVIVFSGGTLGFSANNVFDYSGRFTNVAGEAYSIDTGGQNVTFTNAAGLGSSGGTLAKVGAGTLTLAAASSYSGLTFVSAGKLVFQGSKAGSGNIIVADGAALGVTTGASRVAPGTLILGSASGATLEFNNVTNTTVAPLAAGTVTSAGTLTININSGTFTTGHSYPLLGWTSGLAPAVSLGNLNDVVGTLSTNGNVIQLNVTSVTVVWTGAHSGNWTDPNNWAENGVPMTYFNPSPVIFDDTATGTTAVIVDSPVQPTTVTVNNSVESYSIASNGGNNIGGSTGLTKIGSGTLTLSGGANTYSGVTTISGGTVSVSGLSNGGSASDIGTAAARLVLNGGTLQYTGTGVTINRLFTLTTAGGAIDGSGAGGLTFNNSATLGFVNTGARALTLTGSAVGNTLAPIVADHGGATSLTISGTGKWILTGNNTYSGVTTISGAVLQIGAGGATGSLGTGSIVDNGGLDFNRTNNTTVSGVISGTGSLTNDGTGTVILLSSNTYAGGTVINAGTLELGNGGSTGGLNGGGPILDNGTLVFNSTNPITLGGPGIISGTGNVMVQGSGPVDCYGSNTYTGWTTISAGALFQPCDGNQGQLLSSVVTNNGTLKLVRQDNGFFGYTNNIVGLGIVWKDVRNLNPGDVTLLGTNTYSGGTFIAGGAIILGDGATTGAGSLIGNVVFTNSAVADTLRTLEFNRPDNLTFDGNIVGAVTNVGTGPGQLQPANAGAVMQNGTGTLTLTGTNTYPAGTIINSGTLQVGNGGTSGSIGNGPVTDNSVLAFNRSDMVTWSNTISGSGSFVDIGTGTLTFDATNEYFGTNSVSAGGSLFVNAGNNAESTTVTAGTLGGVGTFHGPVTLAAGTTLAPGPIAGSVGTLTINSDLMLSGNLAIDVNKSQSPSNDLVVVSGTLKNSGTGTITVTNHGPALVVGDKFTLFSKPMQNGAALTVTGSGATWANHLAVDGSISVLSFGTGPTLSFSHAGGNLQFSWIGAFKLQSQTNGLGTNWVNYPGGGTSPITVPIGTTNRSVFFRLVPGP